MYRTGKFYTKLAVPDGTTFPTHTSIEVGSLFHKNDEGLLYIYSGEWRPIPVYTGTPSVGDAIRWNGEYWIPSGISASGGVVGAFLDLTDVPNTYAGVGGYTVTVKDNETGLEFSAGGAVSGTFISLNDTPASYVTYSGYVLTVNSTEDGIQFSPASVAGGEQLSQVIARAATAQDIDTATWTKIEYDTEEYDALGEYDPTTNYRFTATNAGRYYVTAQMKLDDFSNFGAAENIVMRIYVDGVDVNTFPLIDGGWSLSVDPIVGGSALVDLAAGQYIEIYVYQTSGDTETLHVVSATNNRLSIFRIPDTAGASYTVDNPEALGGNLTKNSPGQIAVDGAEPQWWDDVTNATITDEDAAGESCEDKTKRVFKVVTTANDVYGYQTLTFADEDLMDAGQTAVSFGCWVWCASASKASIGIYGTNLTLQESSQHTGGSGWEWLTIENKTLHASDTNIEIRLIVDTGTAFFTMPMLSVGATARPWVPRDIEYVARDGSTALLDLNTTGDVAWSDLDCTAHSDNLATAIHVLLRIEEPDGTLASATQMGHDSALTGVDFGSLRARIQVTGIAAENSGILACDDAQIVRYTVIEQDADADMRVRVYVCGYRRWI